eukprot:737085-Amphidinium_carterae.1
MRPNGVEVQRVKHPGTEYRAAAMDGIETGSAWSSDCAGRIAAMRTCEAISYCTITSTPT